MKSEREILLTAQEVAEMLSLKPSTVYAMSSSRQIRRVKIGRALRFKLQDIQRLIEECVEDPEEINIEIRP